MKDKRIMKDKHTGLEIKDLKVSYNNRLVLEHISFGIETGKLGVILGPNGAGKTSLIKAITGEIKPCEGAIYIDGMPLLAMSRKDQAKCLSFVPQENHVVYNYNVREFVLMGRTPYLSLFGTPKKEDYHVVDEAIDYLGITALKDRNYLSLSGGEKQMVLLARSLVQNAKVMIMDEPTTYLDYQKQHSFLQSLKNMVQNHGITAVITLHDPNLALKFADKIIMIHDREVITEADRTSHCYMATFNQGIKAMYGEQVRTKHFEGDYMVSWG